VIHLGALGVPPEGHDYLCGRLSQDYGLNVANVHYRGFGASGGLEGV
jgi:hypothetical protein